MTLRAIIHEQPFANGHSLRIARYIFRFHAVELGIQRLNLFVTLGDFRFVLADLAPAKLASVVAETWIQGQVAQGKNDSNDE